MCGIVALIRNSKTISSEVCTAFEQMWWGTQLRGLNGSGVFQVSEDGKISAEKSAFTPDYAIYEKNIKPIVANIDVSPFTVAHCRAATRMPAKVDEKWLKNNAHPFSHENITLVHNGYFSYVGHVHKDAHEVDSGAFTCAVADKGIDKALDDAYGAYALVFYDSETKQLNLVRNNDRPLWRLIHPIGHIYISEPDLALWIFKRLKMPAPTAIEEVATEQLIQYDLLNLNYKTRPLEKPFRKSWAKSTWPDWNNDDDDYSNTITYLPPERPAGYEKKLLTLDEVLVRVARYKWSDCAIIARVRRDPMWTPALAEDYRKFLASSSTEPEKHQTVSIIPFVPPKRALPVIQEAWVSGSLLRIYHEKYGFSIVKGTEYTFSIKEIHEHKGFCSIIGQTNHPLAQERVRIMGNIKMPAGKLRDDKKMLVGEVTSISKAKESGVPVFTIQMGNLQQSDKWDIHRIAKEDEDKSKPKPDKALLLVSKNNRGEAVNLEDLVTCVGCRTIVNKKDIGGYTHNLFKDDQNRVTTKITVNVCRDCQEKCSEDFDQYYQHTYLKNVENNTKGMQ